MLAVRFALVATLIGLAGCAAGGAGEGVVCRPGESAVCICASGSQGTFECRDDGRGFTTCECGRDLPDYVPTPEDARDDTGGAEVDAQTLPDVIDEAQPDVVDPPDVTDEPEPDVIDLPDVTDEPEPDIVDPPDVTDEPDVTSPGSLALGDDCERSSDCATGICLGVAVAGVEHSVCTEPCCHEAECPLGFGCLRLGAGRWCLPSRIYPPGYSFTSPTGASCGIGGNACQSGICEASNDLCRGTCCTDADCGVAPCHWTVTGASQSLYCDPLALLNGFGRTGDPCFIETDCQHGICVPSPVSGYVCAEPCCGPHDCTPNTTCGLVQGVGGSLARACVPQPPGPLANGEACSDTGESCVGGHCIDGMCRTACCLDSDCATTDACRPAYTPEGVVGMFCMPR